MATIFRPPIVTPPWKALAPVDALPPNLLLTTLAQPFRQADWPAARIRPYSPPDAAPPNLLLTALARPFNVTDWPAAAFRLYQQETHPPNLLVTTLYAPAPFAQFDWPTARAQMRADTSWIQGTPLPLLVPSVLPFGLFEWSAARAAAGAVYDQPPNLLTSTLAPVPPPATGLQYNAILVHLSHLLNR